MQTMKRIAVMSAALAVASVLAACGSTSKLMGKTLPDETQVIDGPTLALPPQFELRPPRESADYESVLRAQKGVEAQNLITTGSSATVAGVTASVSSDVPAGDEWLLDKTHAQTGVVADPNVRQELVAPSAEELKAAEDAKAKKGLFGRWFGKNSADDE